MAATLDSSSGESRRAVPSPRPKGRENARANILCRNVTIYGHCKYEDTCQYYHPPRSHSVQSSGDGPKRRFNVDSPSFTPLQPSTNGAGQNQNSNQNHHNHHNHHHNQHHAASSNHAQPIRGSTISPKAANAAPFTPKSARSAVIAPPTHHKDSSSSDWSSHEFQEFVPQNFDAAQLAEHSGSAALINPYDPFTIPQAAPSMATAAAAAAHQAAALNPYVQDPNSLGAASFFSNAPSYTQPLQYHLYAPMGPHRENLLAYQRTAHDFFMPDELRQDLQRKAEASRQVLPNSTLPGEIEYLHSLVPLDINNQKNPTLFGYPTWVYKAVSSKDGNTYALRRLEGFRLTNERAIRCVQAWKRIDNAGVATILDAFTTRAFGDSSLIFVTNYHPLSRTLAEQHFTFTPKYGRPAHVPEQILWGYIVQIASALKTIHANGLAARMIHPSKILVTSKDRIRLNACAILDVIHFDSSRPLYDLQQDDLVQLGRLILSIASNNAAICNLNLNKEPANAHVAKLQLLDLQKTLENLSRAYSDRLKECVTWLLSPPAAPATPQSPTVPGTAGTQVSTKDIDLFLSGIASHVVRTMDSAFHSSDTLSTHLARELENGRLVRLLAKLNFINERPEYEGNAQWSETGERYYLKLFRDYVFHQVDANGHPAVDLAHVLACLNKLDAGSEERISLVSRDEQNVLVVSYKEIKRGLESAFQDLVKGGRR